MKKTAPKIVKAKTHTLPESKALSSLRMKLKTSDPEVQNYVAALEKENFKLQKYIAKLQAKDVTSHNRIKVLEAEQYKPKVKLVMDFGDGREKPLEK